MTIFCSSAFRCKLVDRTLPMLTSTRMRWSAEELPSKDTLKRRPNYTYTLTIILVVSSRTLCNHKIDRKMYVLLFLCLCTLFRKKPCNS